MRYYFYKNKIRTSIQDMTEVSGFVEFTEEQKEFYLANPDASVNEVRNCKLRTPYVPYTPTLEETKTGYIDGLSNMSLGVMEHNMPNYKIVNSLASLNDDNKSIYNYTVANANVEEYNHNGTILRNIFYTYKTKIEESTTVEDATDAFNAGEEAYDNFVWEKFDEFNSVE